MATILDGTTLAEPTYGHEGMEWKSVDIAARHDLADGSVVLDYVNTKWRIGLHWQNITQNEMNNIRTEYVDALEGPVTFVDTYLSSSITVFAVPGSFRRTPTHDSGGTSRWNVDIELEQLK